MSQGSCGWTNDSHPDEVGVTQAPVALNCVGGRENCFKLAFLSSLSYNLYGLHAIMIQLSFALINKKFKIIFIFFLIFFLSIYLYITLCSGLSNEFFASVLSD